MLSEIHTSFNEVMFMKMDDSGTINLIDPSKIENCRKVE